MASEAPQSLLTADDPSPVEITNDDGASLFLLLGDHAGNLVPRRLGTLGLEPEELSRHIAMDIGVAALGRRLADRLDAPFVAQRYSRLVVDCNRSKGTADGIAVISDGTVVRGNTGLDPERIGERHSEIFDPYHAAIERLVQRRSGQATGTVVVSLHSFTPVLAGKKRPWDIGVLYEGGDTAFARQVLDDLRRQEAWCIGDNEPYRMDETDFTIPLHCYARKLPYVELEIRQDHLGSTEDIHNLSTWLGEVLLRSAAATGNLE